MFCVIQQVQLKKPNQYGAYRELVAELDGWTVDGKPPIWRYRYTGGRFDRPHLEAYRISIHQSYRENGKVRKKQYSIRTMSYYSILEYSLFDCAGGSIEAVAEQLGVKYQTLYDLIESKLTPLLERLEADFHQSEEYQTRQKHQRIIKDHQKACADFCAQYGVDTDEITMLKQFYKVLSKKYHPDLNPDKDTTKEMQLLNRIKQGWGI